MSYEIKETLIEILNENQLEGFSPYVRRNYEVTVLPRKAVTILGVRRAGKTTFLKQIWDQIRDEQKNCVQFYLNFSDDRIANLKAEQLQLILDAITEIEPEIQTKKLYLYLDEIQLINSWEFFVDRLLRRKNTQIFLSGSSAKLLSQEIATEMRGRSISIEITPYSFKEFLQAKKVKFATVDRTSTQRIKLEKEFQFYLLNGGFPETVSLSKISAIPIVQEYLHSIFYRDVVERHNISDPNRLFFLLKSLIQQSSSLYSVNRITDKMKSLGYRIDKSTVAMAIQWFNDAFCLFSIPCFSESIQKQQINPKKIYSIDNGLIQAIQTVKIDYGHLLENLIFQELKRRFTRPIFYFKTSDSFEIDFLVESNSGHRELIQVCYDLSEDDVFEREIRALEKASEELGIKKLKVIYVRTSDIKKFSTNIEFIQAWRFLLN
jgi:predicted AAA+ superfamily ATPase